MRDISVYVHIPFCVKKCLYCDFLSFSGKEEYFKAYKDALISEINNFPKTEEIIVKTAFFGGGTPSAAPYGYISEILAALRKKFRFDEGAEISIEANPKTVDFRKLTEYRQSGANRISIGAQSFSDRLLKKLGRAHDKKDFFECLELVKKAGFDNINIDLMFSLPGQSLKDWEDTLNTAVGLLPSHLSAYGLIIEEKTPFYKMAEEGKLNEVSDEDDRKMYYMAKDILKDGGFSQYEISNFAKKGFECRHNIVYWKRKEYLGFGLGASSFFGGRRYRNNYNLLEYIKGCRFGEEDKLTKKDAYAEFMFLGLRMNDGISKKEFFNYFGVSVYEVFGREIKKMAGSGLLSEDGGRISLTERGIDLSNAVFREFL